MGKLLAAVLGMGCWAICPKWLRLCEVGILVINQTCTGPCAGSAKSARLYIIQPMQMIVVGFATPRAPMLEDADEIKFTGLLSWHLRRRCSAWRSYANSFEYEVAFGRCS